MLLTVRSGVLLTFYICVAVLPLALGLIDLDPGRGFWINFSVAMGFVALSMLGLQFLLAARTHLVSDSFGMDAVLRFHKQITYVALFLILAHPMILFLTDSRFLPLLNVFTSPLRAKFAVASVVLVLILVITSVWRSRLRLAYDHWQLLHALLAVAIVITALAHTLLVGYYVREPWEQLLWIFLTLLFVALGVWVRIVKPLLRRKRRWVVEKVAPDAGGATRIDLRIEDPDSYPHGAFQFEPGQFAWILMRRSPFSLTYHPFSFTSSAEESRHVSFTVKAFGRFTHEIGLLEPGELVYLDGPYGSFRLDHESAAPVVLIGGGVGVTPLVSILETLADRGDSRPCVLLLGNRDLDNRTCGDQIDALAQRLDLTVVDVLSEPPQGWTGESGRIDEGVLRRHLPERHDSADYFICGPPGMMDAVTQGLRALRVPSSRIQVERFEMV